MKSQNCVIRFSNWLLSKIYDDELYDEIHGDLLELYEDRIMSIGKRKAALLYLWDAILSVRNVGLRKRKSQGEFSINLIGMLKNILKVALRSLKKDKVFSGINILGLSIGITCSMLLFMYIMDELSYDRYHKQARNIYRVVTHFKDGSSSFSWPFAERPMAEELRDNYPQIEQTARFRSVPNEIYRHGENQFVSENFFIADQEVFDIFSYHFLYGDSKSALKTPSSIVLTEKVAKKYFGDLREALGQSLQNEKGVEFKITGIIENVPINSHFWFDALISNDGNGDGDWLAMGAYTYLLLPDGYNPSVFDSDFARLVKEKVAPTFDKVGLHVRHELEPITTIHLYSKIPNQRGETPSSDISYIYIFGIIALFLITIACINYMNLATGRSLNRAKEIGIRKVVGSQRSTIVYQFLFETVIIAMVSLIISLTFIYLLLPSFNTLANKQLTFMYIFHPDVFVSLIGLVAFIGIVGGSYPALYLSGFDPALVLKGKFAAKGGSLMFRKSLVVMQFAIAIFMLFSTLVVFNQLEYMKNTNLGFDKHKVFRLDLTQNMFKDRPAMITSLKQIPGIVEVGTASSAPGKVTGTTVYSVPDKDNQMTERSVNTFYANWEFAKTLGITITNGRDFSRDIPSDTQGAVLVNETMVKQQGWKEPIGKKIIQKLRGQFGDLELTVVGVVQDFHQSALFNPIAPLIIACGTTNQYVFIRYEGDVHNTLIATEKIFKDIYRDHVFDYNFLDQDFNSQYKADETRGKIFSIFSGLAIFISCLGLIGFTAFTIERRLKEICIRKVSGASVKSLLILISKDFFVLVLIGIAAALPFAYYFASGWLQNFAYKIALEDQWSTFLLAVAFTLAITFITTLFHVYRASTISPVTVLKE